MAQAAKTSSPAFGWTGVVSSGVAFVAGRLAAVAFLVRPTGRAMEDVQRAARNV